MNEEWGLLDSGHNSAAINMAIDELLIKWHKKGHIPTTLRFYGWSKPSLSVGYFQKLEKINFNALEEHNCQFVKRLTGGSAVLHDDELTYSITISEQHPKIPKSIREAYYVLSKGIVAGYKELSIDPDYSIPENSPNKTATSVCFEQPALYELLVNNKKISGNAQIRKNGILMQHGSIPISINEQMLFDLFVYPSDEIRQAQRANFKNKASTINELTGQEHSFESVKSAFIRGFKKGLNISLIPYSLTEEQWQEVAQLAEEKYNYPNLNSLLKNVN